MPVKKRICFVCLGNIVRSPLAENLFIHLAKQAGVENEYIVDSAGTSAWHEGEAPDARMRRVAERHGLQYGGSARQFKRSELDAFDLILALDRENWSDLNAMARTPEQRARIHLLREFDPQSDGQSNVPDPYYGGIDGFEITYQIVERSVSGLLGALQAGEL
ncbi:MAG: low molecular weight protein-tyrosine-phosphatase [Chloroflexota bacterium]